MLVACCIIVLDRTLHFASLRFAHLFFHELLSAAWDALILTSLKSLRLRKLLDQSTFAYWVLLDLTGPYWALLGLTGPYWALQGALLHLLTN